MADIEQLSRAFMAADKAGDTEAATLLAQAIRDLSTSQAPQDKSPAPTQAEAPDTSILGALGQGVDQSGAMVGKGIQSAGEFAGVDAIEAYGAEMAQRNEAQLAASNYQRPEGADGIIKNLKEGEFANAGNSLLYGAAEATPQVAGGVVASVGAGLAATSAPILGTAAAIGGTIYGTINALGQVRDEKEQQELDPTATGADLATAVASGLVELLPIKGGGATLKVMREAGQEGVQEGLIIGNSMVQGGEYVPQEVFERVGDAAITGGAIAKGVNIGISTVNKAGEVVLRPKEDLDPETTQAASDVSTLLQRVADENGYNLKDIDASSKKGAKQALESARGSLLKEVDTQVIALREKGQIKALSPEDKAFFKQAIRESNGKVGTTVTKENFDFMKDRFGQTEEGQRLLNAFRRTNVITEVQADGLKGGVSQFTDAFNPLPKIGSSYNPAGMIAGNINTGAALATGGASLAAQIPLVVGGRAIDAVTGRRSKVNRFIKKNRKGDGLADPTAPAARDLKQEAKDRRAAEDALRKQQSAEKRAQEAEATAATNIRLYNNGLPPIRGKDGGTPAPRGVVFNSVEENNGAQNLTAAEFDSKIQQALELAKDRFSSSPETLASIEAYEAHLRTGSMRTKGKPLNEVAALVSSIWPEVASSSAQTPATPAQPRLPIERQLGKNSNQAYLATLRDKMDNDTSVLAGDRATLGDAFDSMALNLSKNPVASLKAIINRAEANLMKPNLSKKYLQPYLDRVDEQQKTKEANSE